MSETKKKGGNKRKNGGGVRLISGHRNPLFESGKLRNKPCVCRSGIKSKKCCGRAEWAVLTPAASRAINEAIAGHPQRLHVMLIDECRKGKLVPDFIIEKMKEQDAAINAESKRAVNEQ